MMPRQHQGIGMTSSRTRERLVQRLRENGIHDQRVLRAISTVPRHMFVDEALSTRAYEDSPLPIGLGQTISQPYIVALMTQELLAAVDKLEKVLEIGTGSGYQAAVLAQLVPKVFSLERLEKLLRHTRRRFHQLGLHNIYTRHADGAEGWRSQAPFDGIIVTAACPELPPSLLQQLAPGGCLIAPVERDGGQRLIRIRYLDDEFKEEDLGPVTFVPLLPGLN
ncbi:MAG: protein-L-isoaspartate(D-aspartate) O-methyltransferase [Wenzhouxiangellaceae bacterium]